MATATLALKTVEEIRELLHVPTDEDPFMFAPPAWQWQEAEHYGTANPGEPEDERARR
jgi:hypothetical protein